MGHKGSGSLELLRELRGRIQRACITIIEQISAGFRGFRGFRWGFIRDLKVLRRLRMVSEVFTAFE